MGRQRLGRRLLLALMLLVAGSAAHAQLAEFSPENPDEFYERLDEHGRVSGDIFMGVMIGPAEPLPDAAGERTANVVARNLPIETEGAPNFCVRINSKDGRLEVENTYVANAAEGMFRYIGRYGDDLAAMSAVSLVRVGRCGDRSDVVVPSVWEGAADPFADRALHVFANTAGNPAVVVVGDDPGFVPCTDVADPTTLKYTAVCTVGFDLLARHATEGSVALALFVARSLGEDRHDMTVILPDGEG